MSNTEIASQDFYLSEQYIELLESYGNYTAMVGYSLRSQETRSAEVLFLTTEFGFLQEESEKIVDLIPEYHNTTPDPERASRRAFSPMHEEFEFLHERTGIPRERLATILVAHLLFWILRKFGTEKLLGEYALWAHFWSGIQRE